MCVFDRAEKEGEVEKGGRDTENHKRLVLLLARIQTCTNTDMTW